jgi:hypothetical protein
MLSQLPLPRLPSGAAKIAPDVGLVTSDEGVLVTVHGLATFAWDGEDEAGPEGPRTSPTHSSTPASA